MSKTNLIPTGKISKELLDRYVFTCLGQHSSRVISGSRIGEDAAVIDMGETVLVAKSNPITGAEEKIGQLAVYVNANDVAVSGAKPKWFLNNILLPEGSDETVLETIMKEINEACIQLGVCVVGGHTEVAPGLQRPIVSGFMLGEAKKSELVLTSGASIGDVIILTKGAGIEGTGILASDLEEILNKKVSKQTITKAKKFLDETSVVNEALKASEIGVKSMHTPTEGGILNGLYEISEAAQVGVKIYESDILIADETKQICGALNIDPLKLLSSGSLLIVSDPDKKTMIIESFSEIGVKALVIGKITSKSKGMIIQGRDGIERKIGKVDQDELYRILNELENK
jgi:hydrogenase maturation factor